MFKRDTLFSGSFRYYTFLSNRVAIKAMYFRYLWYSIKNIHHFVTIWIFSYRDFQGIISVCCFRTVLYLFVAMATLMNSPVLLPRYALDGDMRQVTNEALETGKVDFRTIPVVGLLINFDMLQMQINNLWNVSSSCSLYKKYELIIRMLKRDTLFSGSIKH